MADDIMLDHRAGTEKSLSPFFGAGTAKPVDWIYRNEGEKITAAGLVSSAGSIDNASDTATKTAVISAQISGIAGYTKFQGQVTMVKVPV